ncbi:ABC transporter ATP-binding protein [Epilithonimonas sp. UC225_85]|uniref:ABC transporter ATP-binding protein n=1 Tax=Epilithonimonas sp. UC225_85 TaxID=3350167 RepID=UPI0036D3DD0C
MSEILIKAESVSKKFCKDLKLGLLYGMQDLGSTVFGSEKPRELRKKEFWAVEDINFEVKRGECLGLLGHNGAGKSTLLKVLTGLIAPDKGRIEMHGRVNALIELTAGFNPILTGRENIFNNGAVLGLSDKEIKSKFDEIVAFSELEEFIDTPVQYYSSGMKVRLGFSVAVHTDPDVLILDEVLSVGDAGFRAKSFNKMMEIMQSAAVIFVSHSMPQVARTCDQVMFMRNGKSFYYGDNVNKGIEMYFGEFKNELGKIELDSGAEINDITVNSERVKDETDIKIVNYGDPLSLEFDVKLKDTSVKNYYIQIQFIDKDLKMAAIHYTHLFKSAFSTQENNRIKIIFPDLQLVNGEYGITYFVVEDDGSGKVSENKILCIYRNFTKFIVRGLNTATYTSFHLKGDVFQNNVRLE